MRTSRLLAGLAGAALALGPALPAAASHDVTPARIGGQDRYDTAVRIALAQYGTGTSEVIVASGTRFPDALAGAPVAAELDAPILLTKQDELPEVTSSAIDQLNPDHVTILGGPVAVSEQVEATIAQSARVQTSRIEGTTRYETAAEATRFVQERNDNNANWPGGQRAVFLATGEQFPDALTAGAPAASRDEAPIPILLTQQDQLSDAAARVIEELNIELVVLVGGEDAIAQSVQDTVEDDDTTTDRVAGATRTATATQMADYATQFLGFNQDDLTLSRGDLFPDALAVAPLAGANRNPILLTETPEELSEPTRDWLARVCGGIDRIRAVGGEMAVTPEVLDEAEETAEDCHGTQDTDQTFIVAPQEPRDVAVSSQAEFSVGATYDGSPVPDRLWLGVLPCENYDLEAHTFTHTDGTVEGFDEDFGPRVYEVNGERYENVDDVWPTEVHVQDDVLTFSLLSDQEACAIPTVFQDTNDNGELDVDSDGTALEPYGIGKATWS